MIDPNFAVLLQDQDGSGDFNTHNECTDELEEKDDGKGFDPILVAIIVVPVVGTLALALLFITVIYPRLSTWYQLKKGAQQMMEVDEMPSSPRGHEPVIESAPDFELHTAAGRFVVKM